MKILVSRGFLVRVGWMGREGLDREGKTWRVGVGPTSAF